MHHIKIERDLSFQERLERQPLQALISCLTEAIPEGRSAPLSQEYIRPDWNSLQLWTPDDRQNDVPGDLIAQVAYLKVGPAMICKLFILPHHKSHAVASFPTAFEKRMLATLKFHSAALYSTTNLRYDYRQTNDLSSLNGKEAVSLFPYEVYPEDLTEDLVRTLTDNPGFLLQSRSGLHNTVARAMTDHNLDPSSYGRYSDKGRNTGKGRSSKSGGRNSSKGKGKSKETREETASSWPRPAATWGNRGARGDGIDKLFKKCCPRQQVLAQGWKENRYKQV